MDLEIRAEAVIEPKDYLALNHFITYSKGRSSGLMNLLVILLVAVAVYADIRLNQKATVMSYVAIIVVIVSYILPEFSARRAIQKDTAVVGQTFRYVFNEEGLNLLDVTTNSANLLPWASLLNVYETKEYVFVFLSKQQALIVPKRCLSTEDMDDFRELLKFKVGKSFEQRVAVKKSKKAR